MKDNIVFTKIYEDIHLIELYVVCSSSVATIRSRIYVDGSMIGRLAKRIKRFLNSKTKEVLWANEDKGNDSTACLSLRFLKKDNQGHIAVEVFAELDDGGDFTEHNCCFYVNTEHGLLMRFGESLSLLDDAPLGFEIQLNQV